jgi:hypothetical protein
MKKKENIKFKQQSNLLEKKTIILSCQCESWLEATLIDIQYHILQQVNAH